MKRAIYWIAILALLSISLGACTQPVAPAAPAPANSDNDNVATTAADTTAADEPKRGGTLTAAIGADPQGFDPHLTSAYSSFEVLENVFNTLVTVDANLNIAPSLAESWAVSDDSLSWTFTLHQGVLFHNGREMTAADVKYSYERIMDPDVGSGAAWRLATVDSIEAVDDYTVRINLKEPYPGLLAKLGGYKGMAIVPQEAVEAGDFDRNPVGTGPFKFVSYTPGDSVVLEAFADYWEEGLPYLDQLVFKPIPDDTVRLTNLQTGEVDWSDSLPPEQVTLLADAGDFVVDLTSGTDYWYIGINLNREPFDNPLVRQALNYAINRADVAAAALWDTAVPSQNPLPADSFWYNDYQPYEYNPERAKELLAEAGYPDGFKTELMPTSEYEETVRTAQVLQAQFAAVGIEAEIRTLEWGTWLEEEGAGNFDMYILGWIGNIDPDDYFYAQQHTGQVFNFTGYSNPKVDDLLDQGRVEADVTQRKAIYDQVQQIVIDDSPYIYLYIPANVDAYQSYVKGYQTRPDSALVFKTTWLDR